MNYKIDGTSRGITKMTVGNEATRKLLAETKCSDLVKGHPVIEIDASASVAKACSVQNRCHRSVIYDLGRLWYGTGLAQLRSGIPRRNPTLECLITVILSTTF